MTTTVYDAAIKKACRIYLPMKDWRLIKAQLMAESHLDPNAISPVGARGIAQFMPETWEEVANDLGFPEEHGTAHDPVFAIQACCYYMDKLLSYWSSPRPIIDRYCLALASYNAGAGSLTKAQIKAGGKLLYSEIIEHLEAVTGDHSKETIAYVERILNFYNRNVTRGK